MSIDGIKVQRKYSDFLDTHFGVAPKWEDFHKQLKNRAFVDAIVADTRADNKLKEFAKIISMRDRAKGSITKVPSASSGSYTIKFHPEIKRFSCTCPDWTYKKSLNGEDCKHINRAKDELMKTAGLISPSEVLFRIGRTVNKEHKDKTTTQNLKAENSVYDAAYPRASFVSQWLKHASTQTTIKNMAQAARKLLA